MGCLWKCSVVMVIGTSLVQGGSILHVNRALILNVIEVIFGVKKCLNRLVEYNH